jgi:hypothetical protein
MWLLVARNPVGMDQAVTEQNLCCVPSPCIAMLLARQHCPGWMVEHQQAVRGRDLADAIWSGSRVGAGDDSYIKRARARYRPPGASSGAARCCASERRTRTVDFCREARRDESTTDRLPVRRSTVDGSPAPSVTRP